LATQARPDPDHVDLTGPVSPWHGVVALDVVFVAVSGVGRVRVVEVVDVVDDAGGGVNAEVHPGFSFRG